MIIEYILVLLLAIFIIPLFFLFIIYFYDKRGIFSVFYLIRNNFSRRPPFSSSEDYFKDSTLIFTPHPYLNWTPNPEYRNIEGELVHTKEGFRKTIHFDSILQYLIKRKNDKIFKIICIGGSATQCAEMNKFEDTWPAVIQKNLGNKDFVVINFGVGAWTTIQSLIRCATWFPILKPDLLLFYHAKNDLTPLTNADPKEIIFHPDFQNVMSQYSNTYNFGIPSIFAFVPIVLCIYYYLLKRNNSIGLHSIYRPKANHNTSLLKNISSEYVSSIFFRHQAIIDLCKRSGCKVMYIPEIVLEGPYSEVLEKIIYPQLKKNLEHDESVEWISLRETMIREEGNFLDKMHFTKKGNKKFGDLISKEVIKMI